MGVEYQYLFKHRFQYWLLLRLNIRLIKTGLHIFVLIINPNMSLVATDHATINPIY